MPEEILLDLKVDESSILRQLLYIEERTKEVDRLVEKTGKKSEETWLLSVGVAQASYSLIDTITDMMGGTISATMRAVIQGAFSSIALMTSIATTASLTPGMQIAAGLSFTAIGVSIAAAIQADLQAGEIERGMESGSTMLNEISNFIGAFE